MKKLWKKSLCLVLAAVLTAGGCAPAGETGQKEENVHQREAQKSGGQTADRPGKSEISMNDVQLQVDPETFAVSFLKDQEVIPVSLGTTSREIADYVETDGQISWKYPEEQVSVTLTKEEEYLQAEIRADTQEDLTFVWPSVSAPSYAIPLGEGKRVPASDPVWTEYLDGKRITALEELSMPFWIAQYGEVSVLVIMEDPFRTTLDMTADPQVAFSVSHEYPAIDPDRTQTFRIYLTDERPVGAAKIYREYVKETGNFKTLEQKAEENPNVRRLYGAPFVYLAGSFFVLEEEDVNWPAFRQNLDHPAMQYLASFSAEAEGGQEFLDVTEALRGQDYVDAYQKRTVCGYISQVLRMESFWNEAFFFDQRSDLQGLLGDGYESLSRTERLQVNKHALALAMPGVFQDPDTWMDRETTELLKDMKTAGIDRAWTAVHDWDDACVKPELAATAEEQGYLMASYDSYHSIHEPGKEQWSTAAFADASLYENAAVTDRNGEKVSGYRGVGRILNPVLALPAVKERMSRVAENHLAFNSWFIDCDAFGQVYDDYTPSHRTTQQEDLAARLERMSYIRDHEQLVIGSEGGNDFAASAIAFAHGIELPSFAWMDDDMRWNKDSEYYIGTYYNADTGVTENFSKRIPLKEMYYDVFVNPVYDLPLFKLVYNDSVITTYHWDWSTFKIQGATQDRMVREVLYDVPPLYHLDRNEWETYQDDIISHHKVWSEFARKAVTMEMTDFSYVEPDGSVQKTVYGEDLTAVANYTDQEYLYEGTKIPPHSVWMYGAGLNTVYTPSLADFSK